jgi:hypothetical protein
MVGGMFVVAPMNCWGEKFNEIGTCHNPSLGLTTKAKACKGAGQEECERMCSHFGSWSPDGLLNLQRMIGEIKTPRIEEFFISLKSYWSVDV